MPQDPLSELLSLPIAPKLPKTTSPEVSALQQQRIKDAANKIRPQSFRLPYMTYDELHAQEEDDIYDPTDFKTVGQKIRDGVVKAIEARFPIVGDKYTLHIENAHYEKPKQTSLKEEREVLLNEKSLTDRLKGEWVLYDNATGQEVQRKSATLLNVPRMTERGTFIRNGSELGLKHMFRLRPGVYTGIKRNGMIAAHINPAQTTGRQMTMELDSETGTMSVKRGTRTYGLLPILRAAGVSDDEIKAVWGEDLFNTNQKKYGKLSAPGSKTEEEYKKLWDEGFTPIQLDAETTEATLGKSFKTMNPEVLLRASKNMLKVSATRDLNDTDDRDSLRYQRVMGPADYIPERIVRDGGGLLRNLFRQVTRTGNLDPVMTGAFQTHVDSVFLEDKHAAYIDGSSPAEGVDFATSISRLGEGGIGSVDAAPQETRGVNDSYLGFIDPIRSPECHSSDTEYFTQSGWKKFNDITESDKLCCMVKGKVEYHPYKFKNGYDYAGTMYSYDHNDFSFCITHNHRMAIPTYSKRGKLTGHYKFATISELYTEFFEKVVRFGFPISDKDALVPMAIDIQHCEVADRQIAYIDFRHVSKAYDQKVEVGCFTVPGGMLYTRRNGSRGFWSGNSLKVGLDVYLTHGVKKGASGKLYNTFKDRTGKARLVDMGTTANSIVATPEFFNPNADPNEFIPAIYKGKGIEYVQRKDVDFYVDDSNNMMSEGAGMIPLIGGIRSNRTLMGSKYANQALSLKHREAPLVQRRLKLDDGTYTTSERALGKKMGAKFSPVRGTVLDVTPDSITIKGVDGKKHEVALYRDFAANQKGFLSNESVVKPGDRVKEGQIIAPSNYTDKEGTAALGVNLRVAFMTGDNAGTFEDSTMVSESCAKKMASEQMYKTRGDTTNDIEYNKNKYLSLFKNEYTKEQLDKLDENGLPRPGTVFNNGDPVYLGIRHKNIDVHGVSRNAAVPYVATWEHNAPGTVTDVVRGKKHLTVYSKAFSPLEVGDKMCFDDKTEVFTDKGWKFFKDLDETERVLTLDTRTGDTWFTVYSSWFTFRHKGKMYSLTTPRLDICVTPDHSIPVSCAPDAAYILFKTAEEIYGKTRYFLTGHNIASRQSFASNRDKGYKEKWVDYDGQVYCVCVPDTHIMYTRRNGKCVWSGNSARYGNKGINVRIIPDEQMIKGEDGVPFDIISSPLGLPSRLNTSQLAELQLGKIASRTGKVYELPDFLPDDDNIIDFTDRELKKHNMSATETVFDPVSGKHIPGVETGMMFYYKLKHMAELKERGRSTGSYSSEDVPLKGEGAARRFGAMEASAVYAGGGEEVLRDAKIIRGQRNDEFWRDFRDGKFPEVPTLPLVHKKFFAHLQAAGIHLEDRPDTVHMYGATDENIKKLTQQRKVETPTTFDSKTMAPIQGGLFDTRIFGADGDQWGYIELPEPTLNPLMFKSVANILGWKDKELNEYLEGSRALNGKYGTENLIDTLKSLDLKQELRKAKDVIRAPKTTLEQRDLARKRIRAIEPMLKEGKRPEEFFLTRMPVLPPRFRAVSEMSSGVNIAADANFLYKRLLEATEDLKEAKATLPEEYMLDARKSVNNAVKALVGVTDTDDPKLAAKGIAGVLRWAFGKGSPKLSSLHRKVFGANLDLGGLGTIVADNSLTIDQVGIPEKSAWKMFEPFVMRELTQNGYSMVSAIKQVTEQTPEARKALKEVMSERPVLLNRAPTLWRYGIMGSMPVLAEGDAIHVNPNICKLMNADFDGNCADFDTLISLKISKSALENNKEWMCLMCRPENNVYTIKGGTDMLSEKEMVGIAKPELTQGSVIDNHAIIKIGEFPHPDKFGYDKNGARVYEIEDAVDVLTVDPATGEAKYSPVTKFTVEDNCHTVEVTVASRKLIISDNESMAVFDYNKGCLIKVKPQDHSNRLVPVLRSPGKPSQIHSLPRDLGWWMGAFVSDGWLCERYIGYSKAEKAKRDAFVNIARELLTVNFAAKEYAEHRGLQKVGDSVKVHMSGEDLCRIVKNLGMYIPETDREAGEEDLRSSHFKTIQAGYIYWGNDEFLWGLLSGLLDGDGSFSVNTTMSSKRYGARFSTSSKSLRDSVCYLLYALGLRYTVTTTPPRGWSKEAYSICISSVDLYYNLDKLSCVGAQERQVIAAWRENKPPRDQSDVVPISKEEWELLKTVANYKTDNTMYSSINKNKYAIRVCYLKYDDFIRKNIPTLYARVHNTNTLWCKIDKIEDAGYRQVFDLEVPETKVFAANNGVIMYDSMTTHVPVSNEAVRAIKENMLPSKQLISPRNYRAHFIPRSEFTQGLYLASRNNPNAGAPVRFNSEEEMLQAYQRGEIKVDTPVEIAGK